MAGIAILGFVLAASLVSTARANTPVATVTKVKLTSKLSVSLPPGATIDKKATFKKGLPKPGAHIGIGHAMHGLSNPVAQMASNWNPRGCGPTWAGVKAPPLCEDHDEYGTASTTYVHVGNVEWGVARGFGGVVYNDAYARLNDGITMRGTNYYVRWTNTHVKAYIMAQASTRQQYCYYSGEFYGSDASGYWNPPYVIYYGCLTYA